MIGQLASKTDQSACRRCMGCGLLALHHRMALTPPQVRRPLGRRQPLDVVHRRYSTWLVRRAHFVSSTRSPGGVAWCYCIGPFHRTRSGALTCSPASIRPFLHPLSLFCVCISPVCPRPLALAHPSISWSGWRWGRVRLALDEILIRLVAFCLCQVGGARKHESANNGHRLVSRALYTLGLYFSAAPPNRSSGRE